MHALEEKKFQQGSQSVLRVMVQNVPSLVTFSFSIARALPFPYVTRKIKKGKSNLLPVPHWATPLFIHQKYKIV